MGVLGISLDLEECLALGKKREEEEQRRILEMLEPQELYVEMLGGMGVGKAFFKPQEAVLEEAQVIVHTAGFAAEETLLYSPELKFYSNRVKMDKDFNTNIENLYCLGDSSGWTRGLMMASLMGVLMGRRLGRD